MPAIYDKFPDDIKDALPKPHYLKNEKTWFNLIEKLIQYQEKQPTLAHELKNRVDAFKVRVFSRYSAKLAEKLLNQKKISTKEVNEGIMQKLWRWIQGKK